MLPIPIWKMKNNDATVIAAIKGMETRCFTRIPGKRALVTSIIVNKPLHVDLKTSTWSELFTTRKSFLIMDLQF